MHIYTIKSHTDPTKSYTVTFPDTGDPSCTCVGYGYRRSCSHIKEALSQLDAELNSLLHLAATNNMYFCRVCGLELRGTHTFTGLCVVCTRQQTFSHAV